jgi:hypothetical protein
MVGLLTVSPVIKRVSTPVMGVALLIGIVAYLMEMRSSGSDSVRAG